MVQHISTTSLLVDTMKIDQSIQFVLTKIQASQVIRKAFRLLAKLELKIIPTCQRTKDSKSL